MFTKLKIILAVGAGIAMFISGATVATWYWQAKWSEREAEIAVQAADKAKKAREAVQNALSRELLNERRLRVASENAAQRALQRLSERDAEIRRIEDELDSLEARDAAVREWAAVRIPLSAYCSVFTDEDRCGTGDSGGDSD